MYFFHELELEFPSCDVWKLSNLFLLSIANRLLACRDLGLLRLEINHGAVVFFFFLFVYFCFRSEEMFKISLWIFLACARNHKNTRLNEFGLNVFSNE